MKIKNHLRENPLKNIKKTSIKEEDQNHFVISFKHLDKNQGQTFHEWERDGILAQALNTLSNYCHDTLQNQCFTENFKSYGNFPPSNKTEYYFPQHVPLDAEWAAMHVNGRQCLAGHIFRNVFYVVFLDKNHKFWISDKKHT